MFRPYYWAWLTSLLACGLYGLYRWVLRERRKCFDAFKDTGIPGPPIDSLINGNADAFWKPTQIESLNRWLNQYGNVFGFYLGTVPIAVIKDMNMIKQIFNKDFSNFNARGHVMHLYEVQPLVCDSIAIAAGRAWKEARTCMQQFFGPSKLKAMMPSLWYCEDEFIEALRSCAESDAEVNVSTLSERFTFDVIAKAAFGIDTGVQKNPTNPLFQTAISVFPKFMEEFPYHTCQNLYCWPWLLRLCVKVLTKIITDPVIEMRNKAKAVIEFRRQNPQVNLPDLAQILIDDALDRRDGGRKLNHSKTENRAPLSFEEMEIMAGHIMAIFVGGYDTARLTLTYWFYLMGKHPDIQDKMRKEALEAYRLEGDHLSVEAVTKLIYTNQVISETFRMYPPAITFTTRCAEEDYQCGKYLIKKGISVMVPVYQLHHDPLLWVDPEKFDPDRFSPENKHLINPTAYQPFGLGPRKCIGYRFAFMELASVMTQVLRHFQISLGPSQKLNLELHTYALMAVPKDDVWIKLRPLNQEK